MSLTDNFTEAEWEEWAKSTQARCFCKRILERRLGLLEELASLTDPNTLVKDYFLIKGQTEGLLLTISMMQDMIGVNKNEL